jgi:hypothetical protein
MSTYNAIAGGVLPFTPTADHTDKRGFAVVNSSGNAALSASATDIPLGVIVDGQPTTGKSSVAINGTGAIVKVKLHSTAGTINPGTYLVLHTDGTGKADPGTGNRVQYARALEAGANSALIDAVLINPISLS